MYYYIRILLIVIFFSNCSYLDKEKYNANSFLQEKYLNSNYLGMTRKQVIYLLGVPIISDSFDDVYHYYVYSEKKKNVFQKKMLNLYFKENKVYSYEIQ